MMTSCVIGTAGLGCKSNCVPNGESWVSTTRYQPPWIGPRLRALAALAAPPAGLLTVTSTIHMLRRMSTVPGTMTDVGSVAAVGETLLTCVSADPSERLRPE